MRDFALAIIKLLAVLLGFPAIFVAVILCRFKSRAIIPRLIWGPIPIISNKYWSQAMRQRNYFSKTAVYTHYHINQENDFDIYIHRLIRAGKVGSYLSRWVGPYLVFMYAIWLFDIFHHPLSGGFLGQTPLWRCEALLLRWARKKVIILPYGGDVYMYSKIIDPSLRHALLLSYPMAARQEQAIENRAKYWVKYADAIVPVFQIDGIGRWDMIPFNMVTIDADLWIRKSTYSRHDGVTGQVSVVHTPNHRGFKGTEFLIAAVNDLCNEGLKVNLILLEGVSNNEVRRIMCEEADILAEQFVATAYALSGIEGMATGLPVLANLENEAYTRMFRRYSYLNECPILSTTLESLKDNLRLLITRPNLRESLGKAGRAYVEKYHSAVTAQYMFESLYDKIYHGKDVDLMNLFHPLKSEYCRNKEPVVHPLVASRLPVNNA